MDYGKERVLTSDGAAKMVIRHVGDDHMEQCDAVVLLAEWHLVAEKVKKQLQLPVPVPRLRTIDPDLLRESSCNQGCHAMQNPKDITIIRDLEKYESIEGSLMAAKFLLAYLPATLDPRQINISKDPDIIVFKVPGSFLTYAVFPSRLEKDLSDRILKSIAQKPLFICSESSGRNQSLHVFKSVAGTMKIINGNAVFKAKTHQAFAYEQLAQFCWRLPYCDVASKDWLTDPLTDVQALHVACNICLWDVFISKLDVNQLLSQIKVSPI